MNQPQSVTPEARTRNRRALVLIAALIFGAVLLALALSLTALAARKLGFDQADQITIVFCGSKKSLASGVPMAKVLFPAASVGAIVLPLMLFHQMQLMVCAVLARRYKQQTDARLAQEKANAAKA